MNFFGFARPRHYFRHICNQVNVPSLWWKSSWNCVYRHSNHAAYLFCFIFGLHQIWKCISGKKRHSPSIMLLSVFADFRAVLEYYSKFLLLLLWTSVFFHILWFRYNFAIKNEVRTIHLALAESIRSNIKQTKAFSHRNSSCKDKSLHINKCTPACTHIREAFQIFFGIQWLRELLLSRERQCWGSVLCRSEPVQKSG